MTFVPLQEFFPGTLRRPTRFFFMEGSASGILLEDARLSKLMVFSIPCIQRFHNQGPFWSQLHNTHLPFTPENISSSTTVDPPTVRVSHHRTRRLTPMASQVK